eukprot:390855_1
MSRIHKALQEKQLLSREFVEPLKSTLVKSLQEYRFRVIPSCECIHNKHSTSIQFVNLLMEISIKCRNFASLSKSISSQQSLEYYEKYHAIFEAIHCIGFCKECALSFMLHHIVSFVGLISIDTRSSINDVKNPEIKSIFCTYNKKQYLLPIQLYFDIICNLLHHPNIIKFIFKHSNLFCPLLTFWQICYNFYTSTNNLKIVAGICTGKNPSQCTLSQSILHQLSLCILWSIAYWTFKYDSKRYPKNKYVQIVPECPWDQLHLDIPFGRYSIIHYICNAFHSIHQELFDNLSNYPQPDRSEMLLTFASNKEITLLFAFLALCTNIYKKSKKCLYGLHHLGYLNIALTDTAKYIYDYYTNAGHSELADIVHSANIYLQGCVHAMSSINGKWKYCRFDKSFSKWFRKYVKQNMLSNMKVCANIGCNYCSETGNKLKKCSGCQMVYYCKRTCQKQHWNQRHRNQCSRLNVIFL